MTTNKISQDFNTKSLLLFALPTMIMFLFESMYSVVDGIFVANYVGPIALSSINIIYPPILLFMGISIMFGVGGSALIAKKLGEKRVEEARTDFTLLALFLLFITFIDIIIGTLFFDEILIWLGATELIMPFAKVYFMILLFGVPIFSAQFFFQSFFVVVGRPKIGLYSVICAGLTNIFLDYILIVHFHLGIGGAAWATIISAAIPGVVGIVFFTKRDNYLYFVAPAWNFHTVWQSCFNGLAELVGLLAVGVTTFLFNHMMLDLVGEMGVAAITIILYAEYALNSIFFGYSIGVIPVLGYNYGARNTKRLKKVFKICISFMLVISFFIVLVSIFLAPYIIKIFSKGDEVLYALALSGFIIYAFKYLFSGINIFTAAMFTAFQNGKLSAFISFVRSFVLIAPMIVFLPKALGVKGVWLAVPIGEAITFLICLLFLYLARRKYKYI